MPRLTALNIHNACSLYTCYRHLESVLVSQPKRSIDRFHCHAIKKINRKTIEWKKLRNCDVVEDKKK